jgi:hypothetical protein
LLDFLAQLTRPDGTIPLFGDDDGGRLVQLDGRTPEDVRSLLLTGGVVCGRPDWAWLGREDPAGALWLLGPEAGAQLDTIGAVEPTGGSRAFPDSGFYLLREGWSAHASHAVVDAGPHGVYNAAHAHADALALLLTVRGRPLFADAGTCTYPGPDRNTFRGPLVHNTVLVDGAGSGRPAAGFFQWDATGRGVVRQWIADPTFDLFVASRPASLEARRA